MANIVLSMHAAVVLSSFAFAQSHNTCADPMPVGDGLHAFDISGNSASGFSNGTCIPGLTPNDPDFFFAYTPSVAGDKYITVSTGFTALDTWVAVYDGDDCSAICSDSSDGGGNILHGLVQIPDAQLGEQFLIQVVAASGGAPLVTPQLVIVDASSLCTGEDNLEDNDTCQSPFPVVVAANNALSSDISDRDFYSFNVPAGQVLEVFSAEYNMALFDSNCDFLESSFGALFYTNTSASSEQLVLELFGPSPDVCHFDAFSAAIYDSDCLNAMPDSLEPNDTCAGAAVVSDGVYPDLNIEPFDPDYYLVDVDAGDTLLIETMSVATSSNLRFELLERCGHASACGPIIMASSPAGPATQSAQWVNTSNVPVRVLVRVLPPTLFFCDIYTLTVSGSTGPAGQIATFCDPALPNSTGLPVQMEAARGPCFGDNVHIDAFGGPPGEFAFIVGSNGFDSVGMMTSNGLLCVGVSPGDVLARYNEDGTLRNSIGMFNAAGQYQNLVGTATSNPGDYGFDVPLELPAAFGAASILEGETYYFQVWYRDTPSGTGQANLSNGLSIRF